jgi:drug/metabolite transporter (DMT)-like permease
MWSLSAIAFTFAGRHVGSVIVNRARLAWAVLFLVLTHWLFFGRPFPWDASPDRVLWLALSGLIGLVVGDSLLFQCYVLVGARIGLLLLSLAPVFSTLLAWLLLGEVLTPSELAAVALALGGVTWVVLERGSAGSATHAMPRRAYLIGVLFGVGAAICQATNLVVAKRALYGGYPALSATVIRMTTGLVIIWLLAILQRQVGRTIRKVRANRHVALVILGGSFVGPFVGVWLSLVAIQAAPVGIASTLIAMTPVVSLPLVPLVFHERVSPRAVLGTLVAMTGVAIIFLV